LEWADIQIKSGHHAVKKLKIANKPVVDVAHDAQCCVHTRDKLSRTDTQMDTQMDGQTDKSVQQ